MRKRLWFVAIVTCLLAGQSARVNAQGPGRGGRGEGGAAAAAAIEGASTKEESSVTDHTITIGGKVIPYKATASTILLKDDAGDPIGLMYSVAYTRSDVKDLSTRPISFYYNGGPGFFHDVVAHGRVWSAPRCDYRRRIYRARSIQVGGQHRKPD